MKGNCMKKPEEEFELHIRPRPTENVSIEVPKDTLESLKRVSGSRDMSLQALLKLYIGQGLRQDLAKLFGDRVLETAAEVLARHIPSEEEVSAIMKEIRVTAVD
jgi:hypothetical protein